MVASLILGKGQDDVDIIGMSRSIHMRSLEKENKKKLKLSRNDGEPQVEYYQEQEQIHTADSSFKNFWNLDVNTKAHDFLTSVKNEGGQMQAYNTSHFGQKDKNQDSNNCNESSAKTMSHSTANESNCVTFRTHQSHFTITNTEHNEDLASSRDYRSSQENSRVVGSKNTNSNKLVGLN